MEWVLAGPKLQRCRTTFLDQALPVDSALLVGEGNGRFLSELLKRSPQTKVLFIDSSARMLDCARLRLQKQKLPVDGVTFIHENILQWSAPGQKFDLVVTHFFLDCFQPKQLQILIPRLAGIAKPGTRWLLADFQLPKAGWKKFRAQCVLTLMYWFFRWTTQLPARYLACPDSLLQKNGFLLQQRRQFEWELLKSDLWVNQ